MLEQDIFKAIEEEIPICGEYFQEIISDIQIKRIDFENSIFKECKFENCDFSNSSFSNIEIDSLSNSLLQYKHFFIHFSFNGLYVFFFSCLITNCL